MTSFAENCRSTLCIRNYSALTVADVGRAMAIKPLRNGPKAAAIIVLQRHRMAIFTPICSTVLPTTTLLFHFFFFFFFFFFLPFLCRVGAFTNPQKAKLTSSKLRTNHVSWCLVTHPAALLTLTHHVVCGKYSHLSETFPYRLQHGCGAVLWNTLIQLGTKSKDICCITMLGDA